MKNLSDLISQIEDERILRILHQIEQDGRYIINNDRRVYPMNRTIEFIEDIEEEIEYLMNEYECSGDPNYKQMTNRLKHQIQRLKEFKESSYLFVRDEIFLISIIDSAEKCLEFFGEEGQKETMQ